MKILVLSFFCMSSLLFSSPFHTSYNYERDILDAIEDVESKLEEMEELLQLMLHKQNRIEDKLNQQLFLEEFEPALPVREQVKPS